MSKTRATKRGLSAMGLGSVIVGAVLVIGGVTMGPAGASLLDAEPEAYEGNPSCADFGYDFEFKINAQPTNGVYNVPADEDHLPGGATITISNVETVDGRLEFDWSSTTTWDGVLVKQADGGLHYEYSPAVAADQNVQTVAGQNSGGISHVSFCKNDTETTTTEETTTTVEETTTTVEETTTTVESTTTESVLGEVITRTPQVESETLPRTGNEAALLTMVGASLLALGLVTTAYANRRALAS